MIANPEDICAEITANGIVHKAKKAGTVFVTLTRDPSEGYIESKTNAVITFTKKTSDLVVMESITGDYNKPTKIVMQSTGEDRLVYSIK